MTNLTRLLNPQSICYLGGAQVAGPIAASRRAGYIGELYAVNPVRESLAGLPCYASVDTLPGAPDAAVVGLSPERSVEAVAALAKKGCGGAVVMSAGFAEQDVAGEALQKRLLNAAGDMPLIGPNCMGLINQYTGACVWGDDTHVERQSARAPTAALISQSGAMLIGITGVEQALPLGYAISVGNQAGVSVADLINAILKDTRIGAIGLYLEGFENGQSLGAACLAATQKGVPVVALKGGDGNTGAAVSISHTASMVVERDLWNAFCTRFGLVEVTSPKALVETLKLLTLSGAPAGPSVALVSYSGGLNGLAATRANQLAFDLPPPSETRRVELQALLPSTVTIHNPLDLNIPFRDSAGGVSMQNTDAIAEALILFATDCDQLIFFIDVPRESDAELDKVWRDSLQALVEVKNVLRIPVSVSGILPEGLPLSFRQGIQTSGIAAIGGYEEALQALDAGTRWAALRRGIRHSPPPTTLLGQDTASADHTNIIALDEAAGKSLLTQAGLSVPPSMIATIENAITAAASLGYPLALKVLDASIAHKAKVGGVRLGLSHHAAFQSALESMVSDTEANTGRPVQQVLIERMITEPDSEWIIGIKHHAALGLALVVGRGGGQVEALRIFETILLPLQPGTMRTACERVLSAQYVGYVDFDKRVQALYRACEQVADLASEYARRLVTLEVNPVIMTRQGELIAADALVVLREA